MIEFQDENEKGKKKPDSSGGTPVLDNFSRDLIKMASKTGGEIYYANQETNLIESLLKDERFKSIQKSSIITTLLIDWKWILGFIIFLLSVEWFVRKYFGKI